MTLLDRRPDFFCGTFSKYPCHPVRLLHDVFVVGSEMTYSTDGVAWTCVGISWNAECWMSFWMSCGWSYDTFLQEAIEHCCMQTFGALSKDWLESIPPWCLESGGPLWLIFIIFIEKSPKTETRIAIWMNCWVKNIHLSTCFMSRRTNIGVIVWIPWIHSSRNEMWILGMYAFSISSRFMEPLQYQNPNIASKLY